MNSISRWCLGLSTLALAGSTLLPRAADADQQISSAIPGRHEKAKQPSEYDMPLDINKDAAAMLSVVPVYVNISVPHHASVTVTTCSAYPYPVMPPKLRSNLRLIDTNIKSMKQQILNTAYMRKTTRIVAYPQGGWRWQNAYRRALYRSGLSEPRGIGTMYPFVNAVLPYCYEEAKRTNEFEDKRMDRYKNYLKTVDEERASSETEATAKGLTPQPVRFKKFFENGDRQGTAQLAPGEWWIEATHKVPGLTYYWQQPVTVHENEPTALTLNEDNAMLIQGAW